MKKSKAICVLAIVGLLSSTLGGCTVGNTQIRLETIQLHSHKTVFQINSNKCELKYAKLYMCNYRNLYGRAYGMDLEPYDFGSDSLEDYVKDVTLQELARIYCMDMIAQQKKMSLTDEEEKLVKSAAESYYDSLSDEEKSYMDVKEKDIVTAYEHYVLAEKLYKTLTEGVDEEVSDDEARVIHVQQIFVTDEASARTVQDLLKKGTEFATVAQDYNRSGEVDRTVARGEYPKAVEDIAFNLDNDACSDMIEADGGYYFIKCLNKMDKDLTEANKDTIRTKREKEQFEDAYQKFVDSATFQLNESLWDEVKLDDMQAFTTDSFFETYDRYFE